MSIVQKTTVNMANLILCNFEDVLLDELYTIKGKVWVAGGAVLSGFMKTRVNDYDLYFENKSDIEQIMPFLIKNSCISFVTSKAISFNISGQKYQIIYYNEFKNAQEIFDDFDFTCCMCSLELKSETIEVDHRFHVSVNSRELEFNNGTKFPIKSAFRIDKYINKGFTIHDFEKLCVFGAIADLNINSVEEFADQLGGYYGSNIDIEKMEKELGEFSINKAIQRCIEYTIEVKTDYNKKPSEIKKITGLEFESKDIISIGLLF